MSLTSLRKVTVTTSIRADYALPTSFPKIQHTCNFNHTFINAPSPLILSVLRSFSVVECIEGRKKFLKYVYNRGEKLTLNLNVSKLYNPIDWYV